MAGTEETGIRDAAELLRRARELSRAHGSHRLRTLLDMAVIALAEEIERLADTKAAGPDRRGDGPTG